MEIKIGGKIRFENLLNNYSIRLCWIWSDYNQLGLRARWLFYHFICNAGSWNNCYLVQCWNVSIFREVAISALSWFWCLARSWSNWNLEILIFVEGRKSENAGKNLSVTREQQQLNLNHIWNLAGIELVGDERSHHFVIPVLPTR